MKDGLTKLEKDPTQLEALEVVHRNAHSFKSESLTMGYKKTSELSKMIEFILANAKSGKKPLSDETLMQLSLATNSLSHSLMMINTNDKEDNIGEAIQKLQKYL